MKARGRGVTWREHAARHLTALLKCAIADFGQPPSWTDQHKKEFIKRLAQGYPFAERRGWAYKAWLLARADLLVELGLAKSAPGARGRSRKPRLKEDVISPGQLSLFLGREAN